MMADTTPHINIQSASVDSAKIRCYESSFSRSTPSATTTTSVPVSNSALAGWPFGSGELRRVVLSYLPESSRPSDVTSPETFAEVSSDATSASHTHPEASRFSSNGHVAGATSSHDTSSSDTPGFRDGIRDVSGSSGFVITGPIKKVGEVGPLGFPVVPPLSVVPRKRGVGVADPGSHMLNVIITKATAELDSEGTDFTKVFERALAEATTAIKGE